MIAPIKFGPWEFDCEKNSSLEGHTQFVMTLKGVGEKGFKMVATKEGLFLSGTLKIYGTEIHDFAKLIGFAVSEHSKLMPKIIISRTEH